jgi:predicted metal-dependent enzyme (double-stranded beta helix superfamily)
VSAPEERAELARRFLAEARQRSVEQMPPTPLMRECAELRRLLAQVLAVLGERQDERRQLAEIRAVLAAFDGELDDRQLALERIERIAGSVDEPEPTGGQQ